MAQPIRWTDRDLLAIARDERTTDADLARLSPEDQARLLQLVDAGVEAPIESDEPRGPSALDTMLSFLPAAGGAAGGLLGGAGGSFLGMGFGGVPGALGGAALGGAGGEAAEQLMRRLVGLPGAPGSAQEAASGIGVEGLVQGAMEGAGGALMKGAAGLGRLAMRKAVRPNPSLQKAFRDVDIPGTLLRERLPVGASGKAEALRGVSARETSRLLREAGAVGVRVQPAKLAADSANDLGQKLLERGLRPDAPEFKQVGDMVSEWVAKHERELTPSQANELKRAAQKLSKAVMRMEQTTGGAEAATLAGRFQRGLAKAAKATLEDVPGVRASNQRTQGLIAATKALQDVEARNTLPFLGELGTPAAAGLGALSGGAGGAFLGALLFRLGVQPRTLSRLGISLTHPVAQRTLGQVPRLAGEAGGKQLAEELVKEWRQ